MPPPVLCSQGWLLLASMPEWTPGEWDLTMLDFMEYLFDQGYQHGMGARSLAAVMWAAPRLARPMKASSPRAMAALRGWGQGGCRGGPCRRCR